MNMYPKDSVQTTIPSNSTDKQMREEYHLIPQDGNIQSDVVLLNGIPLKLTEKLDIPELKPIFVSSSSPIKVGPDSIVFVHLKGFKAPACA
jgi:heparanase 1